MKPASSEPLIAKVYLQIARLDAFQPGFFRVSPLNRAKFDNREIVPELHAFEPCPNPDSQRMARRNLSLSLPEADLARLAARRLHPERGVLGCRRSRFR